LPAYVQISLRSGNPDAAREAADELQAIAAKIDTPARRAASEFAQGAVLLATGDAREAARHLRLSIKWWNEVEAPYEAAQGRALLGKAIARQGDTEGAILELRAARTAFEKLGAPDASGIEAELLELEGEARSPGGVKVVKAFVFTDIVKSTSLIEAIGDEAWLDLIRWHDQALRASFAEHGGAELDHAGDGFFVVFDAAEAAIGCAVAIQRRLTEHRRVNGFAPHVRMGVHVAAANRTGGSYIGKGVHEAARIAAAAEGGEILVSRSSLELMTNRYAASPPREMRLRGISKPVEVVAIDWRSGVG
jgi:class 3 adenylate cyclase